MRGGLGDGRLELEGTTSLGALRLARFLRQRVMSVEQ